MSSGTWGRTSGPPRRGAALLGQRNVVELDRDGDRYRALSEDGEKACVDTGGIEGVNQSFAWLWGASTMRSLRNNRNRSTSYIENLMMTPDHHF